MRFVTTEFETPKFRVKRVDRYAGIPAHNFNAVKDIVGKRLAKLSTGRKVKVSGDCLFFAPDAYVVGFVKRLLGFSPKGLYLDELFTCMKRRINHKWFGTDKTRNFYEALCGFERPGEDVENEHLHVTRICEDPELFEVVIYNYKDNNYTDVAWAEELGIEPGLRHISINVSPLPGAQEFVLDFRLMRELSALFWDKFYRRWRFSAEISPDEEATLVFNDDIFDKLFEFETWDKEVKLVATAPWGGINDGPQWAPFECGNGSFSTVAINDPDGDSMTCCRPGLGFDIGKGGDDTLHFLLNGSIHDPYHKTYALNMADEIVSILKKF